MHTQADIEMLTEDFEKCQKMLTALGDENWQHLILEMMKIKNCFGARVGEINEKEVNEWQMKNRTRAPVRKKSRRLPSL